MDPPLDRWIVGCMTGTSLDGLDAALVRVRGRGVDISVQYHALLSKPLGGLGERLLSLARGEPAPALEFLRGARELGQLHAEAVAELCRAHLPRDASLAFVAAHGQTIWHEPGKHLSWQLLDPWPMVRQLKVPVVYDLRQADLIAQGQGAPLTPLADWILFRKAERRRYVVNLGGICNLTVLPAGAGHDQILGQDIGPCNLLLDGLVQRLFPGRTFDEGGQLAGEGTIYPFVGEALSEHGLIHLPPGRSLGRENLPPSFFDQMLQAKPEACSGRDVLASAADAIAHTIAMATAAAESGDVVLAGGGIHHRFLIERLKTHMGGQHALLTTDELGIPAQGREAAGFAVLGALCADGIPLGIQRITQSRGAGRAGAWVYP